MSADLRIFAVPGLSEFRPGDAVGVSIADKLSQKGFDLEPSDIVVVTHKIISKAEGQLVDLATIDPSPFALDIAAQFDKDPRQVEVVLRESKRIVRMDRGVIIAETRHGFVCANAGVDASNVATGQVCLLPVDPDRSADAIRAELAERLGVEVGVIVTDSFGRPWRRGITDIAIGVAGLAPLIDYRGTHDAAGHELSVTVMAVADELAGAAELVMNKVDQVPVAVIRGYAAPVESSVGTASDLIVDAERDMFR